MIFTGVQLENSGSNTFTKEFRQATTIINLVTVAQFFEAICIGIFKRLLAAGSTKSRLLGPVLTYFGIVKTNNQEILDYTSLYSYAKPFI